MSHPVADISGSSALTKSAPQPTYRHDLKLIPNGALMSLGTSELIPGYQQSGVWSTRSDFGECLDLPVEMITNGMLGAGEEIPKRIEAFPPRKISDYVVCSVSQPDTSDRRWHGDGFFKDAETWASHLYGHYGSHSAAFVMSSRGLGEGVTTHDMKALKKGASLLIPRIRVANPRAPEAFATARRQLAELARDYEQLDREQKLRQLSEATAIQVRLRAPLALLDDLALARGLSWHTIARMIAITPTAIRKWRRGGSLSPDNRQQLASLVAFFDLLDRVEHPPQGVGSWVEMPVREDTTLTPAEIYRSPAGRWLLLDWVRGNLDTTTMLDRHDPNWRNTHVPDFAFQVGVGPDGERAIIPR
jgi:hypothetical protein